MMYISLETAKLAKQKGFNKRTYSAYDLKGNFGNYYDIVGEPPFDDDYDQGDIIDFDHLRYAAPFQSELQEWLRGKGIHIELIIDAWVDDNCVSGDLCYRAFVWQVGKPKPHYNSDIGCSKYEIILESALQSALELL